MADYKTYHFTKKEWIFEIVRAVGIIVLTGILFLGNPWFSIPLLPASVFLIKERRDKKRDERIQQLRGDFKEFVTSFSSSIQAGYTMEHAVSEGMEDLKRMYPNGGRALLLELEWICHQLKLQISCDSLFSNLAERSGIEEIRSFAVVLGIGKRQGGNLVQITRRAADHINRKIQVQMEVEQAIAGRTMEKDIMFVMPYFMIIYLRITNSTYMDVLFTEISGQMLMLFCLLLLWAAGKWADYIIKIRI